MQIRNITLKIASGEEIPMYRLVADDNKLLYNPAKDTDAIVIDINTDELDQWTEIDMPEEEEKIIDDNFTVTENNEDGVAD